MYLQIVFLAVERAASAYTKNVTGSTNNISIRQKPCRYVKIAVMFFVPVFVPNFTALQMHMQRTKPTYILYHPLYQQQQKCLRLY